jgi:sporulation protein YlmC with PRC-barrel domain
MADAMKATTLLLGAVLAAAVHLCPAPAAAAPAESYTSYLALPSQENTMLRGSLDADEMIGGEVVGADGARIGSVTDLLVGEDGGIAHALVDAGSALGVGSRSVAVDIAQLRRTEVGPRTFLLDLDQEQLAALPAYRQTGDRWELVR